MFKTYRIGLCTSIKSNLSAKLCTSSTLQTPELMLRPWQKEAIIASEDAIKEKKWGVVSAATGSGKTEAISRLCSNATGRILITVPTLYLLNQLSLHLELKYPKDIGLYYSLRKDISKRITICTLQSLTTMVEDEAYEPVSLWIADECHRTETVKIKQAVINYMLPTTAIGFTATAFRASEKEELSLFTDLIYKYTVQDAIKDKSLVPLRFTTWKKKGYSVDEASIEMIKDIIAAQVGPGLVNSSSIHDCEAFSARLCSEGIPAAAIHSQLPFPQIEKRLQDLESGKYKILVHVNMLTEGVNLPWLTWLCMRRDTKSKVRYIQEVGRILRASPNKKMAYVLDPIELCEKFKLSYEAVLAGMGEEWESDDNDYEKTEKEKNEKNAKIQKDDLIHENITLKKGLPYFTDSRGNTWFRRNNDYEVIRC